ncbi:hypothetical protein M8818_002175 [Zalaria obscura]|uniref:Uncharacterized protein n=1 Tax=Zalaria obscura TaxID=2024903 RepID=A0ACC3SK38_9PEZI
MSNIPETDFLQNWMSEDFPGPFSQEDTSAFLFYGGVSTGGWFRDDTPDETGEPWNLAACLHPPFPHEGESALSAPVAAPALDTIFLCPDFLQLDRSESEFGETETSTPEISYTCASQGLPTVFSSE